MLNIGVILYAPSVKYLGWRFDPLCGRLSDAFGGFDSAGYKKHVGRLEAALRRIAEDVQSGLDLSVERPNLEALTRMLLPDQHVSFQPGPVLAGVTADPSEETEIIFERMVTSQYRRGGGCPCARGRYSGLIALRGSRRAGRPTRRCCKGLLGSAECNRISVTGCTPRRASQLMHNFIASTVAAPADAYEDALVQLDELAQLEPGWDDEGAPAINDSCIGRARSILRRLRAGNRRDLPPPEVFPTVDGGVRLYWHQPYHQFPLLFRPECAQVEIAEKLRGRQPTQQCVTEENAEAIALQRATVA